MEHRPVPVRVGDPAKPLGAGNDGPIHAADRRLWHPCWNRGWPGPVPYVQPCDSRALASEAPQLRPRPAVSVSPMARQPAGAAGDRGKECAVCAAVASVCRTVDRHAATRMRGSAAVLVCVGLGRQTGGLPGLLQCASGPMRRWTGGRPSRYERMSHGSTATDGTRIAVVSIRRRSRRDI